MVFAILGLFALDFFFVSVNVVGYLSWVLYAIVVFITALATSAALYAVFCQEDFKNFLSRLKRMVKRK